MLAVLRRRRRFHRSPTAVNYGQGGGHILLMDTAVRITSSTVGGAASYSNWVGSSSGDLDARHATRDPRPAIRFSGPSEEAAVFVQIQWNGHGNITGSAAGNSKLAFTNCCGSDGYGRGVFNERSTMNC